MRRAGKSARKEVAKLARPLGRDVDTAKVEERPGGKVVLSQAAPLFSGVWLRDLLKKTLNPVLPQVANSDGEPLEFVTVHYSLLPGATPKAVREVLRSLPELRAENDHFWNWLEQKAPRRKAAGKVAEGQRFITTMEDGTIVLGNIELKDKTLTLSVNSRSRAERGRALLEPTLAGLVREPLVERETLEQMRAARPSDRSKPPPGLSPQDERAITHKTLDKLYAKMLGEPIRALDGLTPVKAAKTAKGREKVVAWLKTLENHTARQRQGDPMAGYDFTWLWQKLGVADRRR